MVQKIILYSKFKKWWKNVGIRFKRFEFRYRPNKGLCETLNEALLWCQGEYYSAIASDDMMTKTKTECQVNFLSENQDVAAVFGAIKLIDDKSEIKGERIHETRKYVFKEIFLNKHDLPASTQMARLNLIKDIGGYNPKYKIEDWYLLLKMSSRNYSIVYISEFFCFYRFHDSNFSKNMMIMGVEMKNIILEYNENILYVKSLREIYKQEFNYFKNKKRYFKAINILFKMFYSYFK